MANRDVGPLAGCVALAITIQTIFVQLLKKNPDVNSHQKLIFSAYLFGTLYYLFIGIIGGYGLASRDPFVKNP
jgi:hypothetical protein